MTRTLAEPVANTLSGEVLIYVLFPLIVVMVISAVGAMSHLVRRLGMLEQGLAIVIAQVSPPGSPALRELVHAQAVEVAELRGLIASIVTPTVNVNTTRPRP